MPPQPHWEILGQMLDKRPVSLGSAWQCLLPCRGATLLMGGGARKEKERKKRKKKQRKRKSIPSQDCKSQHRWQNLMKLPTSLPVKNSAQAEMPSKHNVNGNIF